MPLWRSCALPYTQPYPPIRMLCYVFLLMMTSDMVCCIRLEPCGRKRNGNLITQNSVLVSWTPGLPVPVPVVYGFCKSDSRVHAPVVLLVAASKFTQLESPTCSLVRPPRDARAPVQAGAIAPEPWRTT